MANESSAPPNDFSPGDDALQVVLLSATSQTPTVVRFVCAAIGLESSEVMSGNSDKYRQSDTETIREGWM